MARMARMAPPAGGLLLLLGLLPAGHTRLLHPPGLFVFRAGPYSLPARPAEELEVQRPARATLQPAPATFQPARATLQPAPATLQPARATLQPAPAPPFTAFGQQPRGGRNLVFGFSGDQMVQQPHAGQGAFQQPPALRLPPNLQQSFQQPPALQPSFQQPSNLQSSFQQPPALQPPFHQPPAAQPSFQQAPIQQTSFQQPPSQQAPIQQTSFQQAKISQSVFQPSQFQENSIERSFSQSFQGFSHLDTFFNHAPAQTIQQKPSRLFQPQHPLPPRQQFQPKNTFQPKQFLSQHQLLPAQHQEQFRPQSQFQPDEPFQQNVVQSKPPRIHLQEQFQPQPPLDQKESLFSSINRPATDREPRRQLTDLSKMKHLSRSDALARLMDIAGADWDLSVTIQQNLVSGPSASDYVCPTPEGHFPDRERCSVYHQCSGGTATRQECPGGLRYNVLTNQCDWAASVDCSLNSDPRMLGQHAGPSPRTLPPEQALPVSRFFRF